MRAVILGIMVFTLAGGSYWTWNYQPKFRAKVEELLSSATFQTLEVRYSAESIMDAHRKELLKDADHVFLEPTLKFVPYLLMDVKYIRSQDKTAEGVILWGLFDGEMVINTGTWEKTHGFTDCITSNATRQEFKIINALAARGGAWDREGLSKFLNIENNILIPGSTAAVKRVSLSKTAILIGSIFKIHVSKSFLKLSSTNGSLPSPQSTPCASRGVTDLHRLKILPVLPSAMILPFAKAPKSFYLFIVLSCRIPMARK